MLDQRDPTKASRWIAVEPNPDAYVVNIGDMLSVWTKGQYKSTVHRVVNKTTRDRCSVPFFFDGKADVRLLPLDGSDPLPGKENLTVLGHMLERFETTYRTNMKHEPTTAPAEVEAV